MHRRPTLAQVAELAGVSHQTVSRVVNGFEGVKPDTRKRVQNAIETLGYRRNAAARALATSKSKLIGVVATGSFLFGPTRALAALEHSARDHGYMILLSTVTKMELDITSAVSRMLERGVDALVIIANRTGYLDELEKLSPGIPIVIAGSRPEGSSSGSEMNQNFIYVNQVQGAEIAIQHLVDYGHRKLCLITGPHDWVDSQQRFTGAISLCYREGITPTIMYGDWSGESGYNCGKEIAKLPLSERPTGIFSANDAMAQGLLLAFHESGISVPNDISIVGFDNDPHSAYFTPPLTTISQDFTEQGHRVLDAIIAMIEGNQPDLTPVPATLILRDSTKKAQQ